MSRTSILILLGLLTILVPFSGLPISFRTLLTVIFGVSVIGIGLSLRTSEVARSAPPSTPAAPTPETPPSISSI